MPQGRVTGRASGGSPTSHGFRKSSDQLLAIVFPDVSPPIVCALQMKNLLHLREDRYLTTYDTDATPGGCNIPFV